MRHTMVLNHHAVTLAPRCHQYMCGELLWCAMKAGCGIEQGSHLRFRDSTDRDGHREHGREAPKDPQKLDHFFG